MGHNVFKFGALYMGSKIQPIPRTPKIKGDIPKYDGKSTIAIGPADKGKSITWIKPDSLNLLIADRALLVEASLEDLNKNGFVTGKPILMNGQYFRCRLLQVGEENNVPNEWDAALDETGEDDNLWHWTKMFFWGADASTYDASGHAVRGCGSARFWSDSNAEAQYPDVGFRPALEPLPSDTLTPNINLDGVGFYLGSLPGSDTFCPILQPTQENVFNDIPVGGKVKMYTFLKDGSPIHFGATIKDASKLTLTDRYYGDEYLVSWTISNGIAVANRPIKQ